MGRLSLREKEIALRKDEILDAAERLLEKGDPESIPMETIAGEAGFTKQTLYAYFRGRDELFASVYLRAARYLNGVFEAKLATAITATGLGRLVVMRDAFLEAAEAKPLYLGMMARYQTKDLEEFRELGIYGELSRENDRLGGMMAGCIRKGIEDGSVDAGIDIADALHFMKACIAGALVAALYNRQYLRSELSMTPPEFMKKVFTFALRAFEPAGTEERRNG